MTKIYLVRHGQSEGNVARVISGHSNHDLTEEGKAQATATKELLGDITFDAVYSSDLQRAIDTAEIIYGQPVPESHQLHALRERNYGVLENQPGQLLNDLNEQNQAHLDSLSAEELWHHQPYPSYETSHQLATRFVGMLHDIAEQNSGKTVLVVAHGHSIKTTLVELGYTTMRQLPTGAVKNAAYVEIDFVAGEFVIRNTFGVDLQ